MLFSVNLVFLATTCFISSYAYKCGIPQRNVWSNNDDYDNRMIIEGRVPKRHELPWIVYVLFYHASDDTNARHSCSGSIISPKHVLTALHCVVPNDSLDPRSINYSEYVVKVKFGSQFKTGWLGGLFKVVSFDVFAYENEYADFVVLHLEHRILFRIVDAAPICLSRRRPEDGETLIVAGHGAYTNRWNITHPEQSYAISNLTVLKDNQVALKNYQFYTGDMNAGSAPGDSGGPAMTVVNNRYYQVGLNIAGLQEKVDRGIIYNHGVYGAIGPFCDSIKKLTGGMAFCQ